MFTRRGVVVLLAWLAAVPAGAQPGGDHHQAARDLQRECVDKHRPDLCVRAQAEFGLAAGAYREHLRQQPRHPQNPQLRFLLADALFWSESYEDAAREFTLARDSNIAEALRIEAALRAVESWQRVVTDATRRVGLVLRDEPPVPEGTPPRIQPVPMDPLVRALFQAREVYLARVDATRDGAQVRDSYDYQNTLLLYSYGYWPAAARRFRRIYERRCSGADADETGQVAWVNLRNMAVGLGDIAEAERLARDLQQRRCTFVAGAVAPPPTTRRSGGPSSAPYRRALELHHRAEGASGAERERLYEQVATMLVTEVDENPANPQAPLALEYAGTALERINRHASAVRIYQRIIDLVTPIPAIDRADQERLDRSLANAIFRLAFNANRAFAHDQALDAYRMLVDAPRLRASRDARVQEFRTDAMINTARILEMQHDFAGAAVYYRRVVRRVRGVDRITAEYRIAEMASRAADLRARNRPAP